MIILTTLLLGFVLHEPVIGQWTQSKDFATVVVGNCIDKVEDIFDARHFGNAIRLVFEIEARIEHLVTKPAFHIGFEKTLVEIIRHTTYNRTAESVVDAQPSIGSCLLPPY